MNRKSVQVKDCTIKLTFKIIRSPSELIHCISSRTVFQFFILKFSYDQLFSSSVVRCINFYRKLFS